ncbi:hypothetical protein GALL_429290 [mine drainage metagenome]|uniref:Uncharacterized protein n=1 Tax=mine drainage metagenome TaxID=410659 RepID=A0A1J5QD38_9ZZZZ
MLVFPQLFVMRASFSSRGFAWFRQVLAQFGGNLTLRIVLSLRVTPNTNLLDIPYSDPDYVPTTGV